MTATIDLIGPGDPADRRRQFADSLERLAATPGPKVVTCVPAPGHEHDVTVALPGLAADPSVLATVVVAPYTPEPAPVPEALPEGFDARITFDRARARARRWPAIDPDRTSVRTYPDERHGHIAGAARAAIADYAVIDPASRWPTRPRSTTRLRPSGRRRSFAICATRSAWLSCSSRCRPPRPRWPRSSTPSRAYSASEVQSFSRSRARHSGNGVVVLDTVSPGFHTNCGDTAAPPRQTEERTKPGALDVRSGWHPKRRSAALIADRIPSYLDWALEGFVAAWADRGAD